MPFSHFYYYFACSYPFIACLVLCSFASSRIRVWVAVHCYYIVFYFVCIGVFSLVNISETNNYVFRLVTSNEYDWCCLVFFFNTFL